MTDREFATAVVRTLHAAGHRALWAGGCVRDELLGLTPHDYDVATDATPERVMQVVRRAVPVGAQFGVVRAIGPRDPSGKHLAVEVATFRADGSYTDGRRPDSVRFATPEEDARRRDFTVNGLFLDPVTGELFDYVGGRADLDAKVLRAIGDPAERFAEDKLRVLRAVRMAARFGLAVDPATLAAARGAVAGLAAVSAERVADELRKTLAHPSRGRGVRLLREFGLIEPVLPELLLTVDLPAVTGGRGVCSVWDHLVAVVDALPAAASFPLAFAALLHPVGPTAAGQVADRLKLSTAEKARLVWLVDHHRALVAALPMRVSRLQPFLVHPGAEDLFALHRAVAAADGRDPTAIAYCELLKRDTPPAVLDPPPLVTGDDLRAAGLKPGPAFKAMLETARDAQLDGEVRTKAEALTRVGVTPPS